MTDKLITILLLTLNSCQGNVDKAVFSSTIGDSFDSVVRDTVNVKNINDLLDHSNYANFQIEIIDKFPNPDYTSLITLLSKDSQWMVLTCNSNRRMFVNRTTERAFIINGYRLDWPISIYFLNSNFEVDNTLFILDSSKETFIIGVCDQSKFYFDSISLSKKVDINIIDKIDSLRFLIQKHHHKNTIEGHVMFKYFWMDRRLYTSLEDLSYSYLKSIGPE